MTAQLPSLMTELQDLFSEVLSLVLEHQFVLASGLPDWYRCTSGSGIGLLHSAVVANFAFYHAVETKFVHSLRARGILCYCRYHDDIFLVFKDRLCLRFFAVFLKANASYFKYVSNSVSQTSITMLDLTITISKGRLCAHPTLTKSPIPLCPTSAHFPAIHRSWPSAVANRTWELSNGSASDMARLSNLYCCANAHPYTCNALATWSPHKSSKKLVQPDRIIMVSRYHPVFRRALSITLRQVPVPPSIPLNILLGWRNALPALGSVISKHNSLLGSGRLLADSVDEEGNSKHIKGCGLAGNVFLSVVKPAYEVFHTHVCEYNMRKFCDISAQVT